MQNRPHIVLMFSRLNELILPVFSQEAENQLAQDQVLFKEIEGIY